MIKPLYFFLLAVISSGLFMGMEKESEVTFEGEILYQKADLADTANLKMYFKEAKVRVDYYNRAGQLQKYKIFNLDDKTICTVNPSKKLYVENSLKPESMPLDEDAEVSKTGNHKKILGYTSYQWIVKNKKRNSVVSYWVMPEAYDYFSFVFEALNRTDKITGYYSHIPDNSGYLLMEAEEFSLVRERRMRLKALKVKKVSLKESLFFPPKDYQIFN